MIEHVWTSSSVIILSSDLFHQINGTNAMVHPMFCGLSHHCFPNIAQHVGIDCTQSILSLLTLLTLPQRHCKISHIFSQSSLLIWMKAMSSYSSLFFDCHFNNIWTSQYFCILYCTGSQEQNLTPNRDEKTLDCNPV